MWLQADNAPIHNSKMLRAYLAHQAILTHPHPANSPCLNAIEELWSIMKSQIHPEEFDSYNEFIDTLKRIWREIDQNVLLTHFRKDAKT